MGYLNRDQQTQLVQHVNDGNAQAITETFIDYLQHLDDLFAKRGGLDRVLMQSKVRHMLRDLKSAMAGNIPDLLEVESETVGAPGDG